MRTTDPETLGKIAYEAYADATGWRSLVTNASLPDWSFLPGPIQAAWIGAATAVRDAT